MKKTNRTQKLWTEEQVLDLVKLIIAHNCDIALVTQKHNELHGARRTEKAIDQQYRRLREIFTYATYQKSWELMHEHRHLFVKPEPQLSKSEQRIAELERQLAELQRAYSQQTAPVQHDSQFHPQTKQQEIEEFFNVQTT